MTVKLLSCKTPSAVLLVAVRDSLGVLRVPGGAGAFPGLTVAVAPLMPILPQLTDAASAFFGKDVARRLDIVQDYADELLETPGGEPVATLYVATLAPEAEVLAQAEWPSMPDILRRLKGKSRIPYLRAWQVLAGGLHLNTKAVDAAELAKHFDD